MLATDGNK